MPIFSARKYTGKHKHEVFGPRKTLLGVQNLRKNRTCKVYQIGGVRLDQDDATIFAELTRRAVINSPVNGTVTARVRVLEADLLNLLATEDSKRSGSAPERLQKQLQRLTLPTFIFDVTGEEQLTTHLVYKTLRKVIDGRVHYDLLLDAHIAQAFAAGWSLVNIAERVALNDFPIAQALHAYYSTWANPYFVLADTLKVLVDNHLRPDRWIKKLEENLAELKRVTGWITCDYNAVTKKVEVRRDTEAPTTEEIKKAMNSVAEKAALKASRQAAVAAREDAKAKALAKRNARAEAKAARDAAKANPMRGLGLFPTDAERAARIAEEAAAIERMRIEDPAAYEAMMTEEL